MTALPVPFRSWSRRATRQAPVPGSAANVTLAVEQLVVVEIDPERARAIARGRLGFLGKVPAYRASFRRMGFTGEEISQLADRLVDALVPWGDANSAAAAVSRQLQAGADHVAISVTTDASPAELTRQWRQLAKRLIAGALPRRFVNQQHYSAWLSHVRFRAEQ